MITLIIESIFPELRTHLIRKTYVTFLPAHMLQVLLIGHIPPGDTDNNADYGQRYLNITKRFKDTIVGHLFGHTHKDHFQLVRLPACSIQPYLINQVLYTVTEIEVEVCAAA